MNGPLQDPMDGRGSVSEAVAVLRQPSILRVMQVLAATVVVLVGIRLGAPILNPILFAVVLTLLFSPIYSWLLRRGLPAPLALLGMLVLLTVLFLGLIFHSGRLDQQVHRARRVLHDTAQRPGGQPRRPDRASGALERGRSRRG